MYLSVEGFGNQLLGFEIHNDFCPLNPVSKTNRFILPECNKTHKGDS
jgi:hypothetical protein